MTDLTDKWKKGELPEGEYYIQSDWCDGVEIRYVHNNSGDMYDEILAPVPTYQEYQALLKDKELWIKRCNNARKHQFNAMKDCKTVAQTLLKVKPELREWLETNFSDYVEQQKDWVNGI